MVTVQELFEHNVHIGHKTDKWNPKMKRFIATQKNKIHIIDLEKTKDALESAVNFLKTVKEKNGKVLFVGTKPQTSLALHRMIEAQEKKLFYIDTKWAPGLLTNFDELRKRADHYLNLKAQFESGEIKKYTKKEVASFKKELEKLDAAYHGVAEMRKKPDVVIALDAVNNRLAIQEAKGAKIPVVALVDTNANPDNIDYVIPGNDDAIKSIEYIVGKMIEALSNK